MGWWTGVERPEGWSLKCRLIEWEMRGLLHGWTYKLLDMWTGGLLDWWASLRGWWTVKSVDWQADGLGLVHWQTGGLKPLKH